MELWHGRILPSFRDDIETNAITPDYIHGIGRISNRVICDESGEFVKFVQGKLECILVIFFRRYPSLRSANLLPSIYQHGADSLHYSH